MAHGDRTERIALRLTPDEYGVLTQLAEETGLSVSDVIRQAFRTVYAERFKKPKPKR